MYVMFQIIFHNIPLQSKEIETIAIHLPQLKVDIINV